MSLSRIALNTGLIVQNLPKIYQTLLMSATLSDDVMKLKSGLMKNAVILKLREPKIVESDLKQVYIDKS